MNYIKYWKLLFGTIISILLALLLNLQYAYAAGIIAMLTIQDTKQETVLITLKRLAIFLLMTILSLCIFPLIGYTPIAFFLILFPYLFICLYLDMKEAIAPIAVLCTHYISSASCSLPMIYNELAIFLIGAGIGVIINLFFQNNLTIIREKQFIIEERMKSILDHMAFYITQEDKTCYTNECFSQLDSLLSDLHAESIRYIRNHFFGKNDYFYAYMQLRLTQSTLLKHIYIDITRMDMIVEQVKPISDFLSALSSVFHESNNGIDLKNSVCKLKEYYNQMPLPISRNEFRNRALLYHILQDLEELIDLKILFMKDYHSMYIQDHWYLQL